MSKTIAVIGGGPAGMMAAATAAENGCRVTLFEKNKMLGKKLLITGKGRCNVTNYSDASQVMKNITGAHPKFMFSALHAFSCYDTCSFFEARGVQLKVERGNRVFPQSDRAADVRNALADYLKSVGVAVVYEAVTRVDGTPWSVFTADKRYTFDAVVIATGGLSYPATGSTGDGYAFAKRLHHRIISPEPALVGLVASSGVCRPLAGLSLKNVGVRVVDECGATVYRDFGEMLFTHQGVSGPVILSASSHLRFQEHRYILQIDLKPALSEQELDARILRDFEKYINKDFINALSDLLPRKLIPLIVENAAIDPRRKVNEITKQQRRDLLRTVKCFTVPLEKKAGYDEAIITAGGVDCLEINPKTMESTIVKGLYFAGEVIDIAANTGGYNLQIAFSTGYLAGISCAGGENE